MFPVESGHRVRRAASLDTMSGNRFTPSVKLMYYSMRFLDLTFLDFACLIILSCLLPDYEVTSIESHKPLAVSLVGCCMSLKIWTTLPSQV